MTRFPTLELGAGDTNDVDFDTRNDIRPLEGINLPGDILALDLAPEFHSLIKLNHVIEHFTPTEQTLLMGMLYQWLIPGGMLLIWTPDRGWMESARASGQISEEWYQTLLGGKGDYAENVHHGLLTQEQMRALLEIAGFQVHSLREIGGSIEVVAFRPVPGERR